MLPLAHQGGWDEILIFAVPVLLYAVIRLWDRRREEQDADPDELPEEDHRPPTSGSPGAGS